PDVHVERLADVARRVGGDQAPHDVGFAGGRGLDALEAEAAVLVGDGHRRGTVVRAPAVLGPDLGAGDRSLGVRVDHDAAHARAARELDLDAREAIGHERDAERLLAATGAALARLDPFEAPEREAARDEAAAGFGLEGEVLLRAVLVPHPEARTRRSLERHALR